LKIKPVYSLLILTLLIACSADNELKEQGKSIDINGETFIGKKINLPEMEAFYKDKIMSINFDSYKGKWIILFFYPGDFTFVCPTELKELSEYYSDFKSGGAEVFSISTDSAHVHKAWHKESSYLKDVTFPMLSDRSGALSRLLGVYQNEKGSSIRASFIINPDRKIVSADYSNESVGRNAGELLRRFDAAIAVSKGGGGMCPAGWTRGEDLIKDE
jgi:peroxiredoxin (alkyl hydroperoxide reductase subunit C)